MVKYRINFQESWNGEPFSRETLHTVPETYSDAQHARDALSQLLSDYPQHERRFVSANAFIVEYGNRDETRGIVPTMTIFYVERINEND